MAFPDNERHFQSHKGPIEDYQQAQRVCAYQFVMNGSMAVDLGAHVGIFSRDFACRGRFRHVTAVEPIPTNIDRLRENVPEHVSILECAVGDKPRNVTKYSGHKTGCDVFVLDHPKVHGLTVPLLVGKYITVPMVTLDSLKLRRAACSRSTCTAPN